MASFPSVADNKGEDPRREGVGVTLIVAAGNWDHVVQVSDRRISSGGVALSDDEDKAVHLRLPTADLLVGYTGLARVGSDSMTQALMDCMIRIAESGEFEPEAFVRRLCGELTTLFRSPPLRRYPARDRRLTVILTGFLYLEGHDRQARHTVVQALITNFQRWGVGDEAAAWDEFEPWFAFPIAGEVWPTLVQRIGNWDAVPQELAEELRQLLAEGKPARAIRDKIVSMLPGWSDKFPTVGPEANCAILRPRRGVEWSHATSKVSWSVSIGSGVVAIPGEIWAFMDAQVEAVDKLTTPPMNVPQVPKNKPCPCRSGLRYRQCHGKPC